MTAPAGTGYDIAGICAHPDDAELVMGGTLIKEAARGRRIAIVDLTRGEAGSRGTPQLREAEAQAAARLLGVAHRESLGLPDAQLEPGTAQRDLIVAAVRRLRPRLVITQHWEQRHPDHAAASRLVYDACFMAGLRNYRPDLGDAFRPSRIAYALTMTEAAERPADVVIDISAEFDRKIEAMLAFASQFQKPPGGDAVPLPFDSFREAVELAARRHGQTIGVRYGEGFVLREPVHLATLTALLNQ